MVDIHCHVLPGLDDGPEKLPESLEMVDSAVADGITHVVATPHSNDTFSFDFARVRKVRDELQALVGTRLILATGCDFHLSAENLDLLRLDAAPFCINQNGYLLLEFSDFSIPSSTEKTMHEMQLMSVRPVITHPERNSIIQTHPERLAAWVRMGCFVQVTGGSVTGTFGPKAQEDALRWIEQGLVHFVASDAHNTGRRPLKLQPAYEVVRKRFGEAKARALFVENPLAAFEGRELPHVPVIGETDEKPVRRRRFLFF
jgi:protein-tyrosine phosphatase